MVPIIAPLSMVPITAPLPMDLDMIPPLMVHLLMAAPVMVLLITTLSTLLPPIVLPCQAMELSHTKVGSDWIVCSDFC